MNYCRVQERQRKQWDVSDRIAEEEGQQLRLHRGGIIDT